VVISTKGRYVKPGDEPPAGERRLYLHLTASDADKLKMAADILRSKLGNNFTMQITPNVPARYGKSAAEA